MEREKVKRFKDFYHEHQPLVLNEEPWDVNRFAVCMACKGPMSGQSYACAKCNRSGHLHKRCGEAPSEVNDLPVFQEHFRLFLREARSSFGNCFFCTVSLVGLNVLLYSCEGSGDRFDLCMKCALFLLDTKNENYEKLNLDGYHHHPLLVIGNHKDELRRIDCDACEEALSDSICVCYDCGIFLHKKCIDQLPRQINHPCHRRHPLFLHLKKINSSFCEICKQIIFVRLSYGCSSCKFHIHLKCAALGSCENIADETHRHTFNFVWRDQGLFFCNACGDEGHYASYQCSTCYINVHEECKSLPRLIRIVRHPDHSISHNYFVKENDLVRCRICFDEVKKEYGCYCCSKEDCNYTVHVNCAIGKGDYQIVNEDDPEEPVEESFQIIEKNDNGEVVTIKHFCHDHYLILGEEVNESDDKCCDGCMLFLSGLFYYCSQCDFFLHKTCAELQRKKNLWFHQHRTTLELASTSLLMIGEGSNQVQASLLPCKLCFRWGSGLFYYCYKCSDEFDPAMIVCLRCASLSDACVHPGHEHLIFFDSEHQGKCIGCGHHNVYREGAFRCKECDNYGLDFDCMTLPIEARHKCDKHLLKLAYRDENDDPKKHYCDVCEKKRDPNHWFYHCSICDNSAHPKCVLGGYPFIKIGSTLIKKDAYPHPLNFIKKVYDYPKCSKCGKPCLDLALECAHPDCNFIVHFTCLHDFFFF